MKSVAGLLLIVLLFTAYSLAQERRIEQFRLLEIGSFHGDEVKARSGEQWLGLYPKDKGGSLLPLRIQVDKDVDPVVDEDPEKMTGKRVSVNRKSDPLFLIKGISGIKPGKVTTVFQIENRDEADLIRHGKSVKLLLGNNEYILNAINQKGFAPLGDRVHLSPFAKLTLSTGVNKQVLFSLGQYTEDAGWELVWAGDLDQDGRLDLYFHSLDYNTITCVLFLSSHAAKGKLVKKVAVFETTGC